MKLLYLFYIKIQIVHITSCESRDFQNKDKQQNCPAELETQMPSCYPTDMMMKVIRVVDVNMCYSA